MMYEVNATIKAHVVLEVEAENEKHAYEEATFAFKSRHIRTQIVNSTNHVNIIKCEIFHNVVDIDSAVPIINEEVNE